MDGLGRQLGHSRFSLLHVVWRKGGKEAWEHSSANALARIIALLDNISTLKDWLVQQLSVCVSRKIDDEISHRFG